MKVLVIPDVHLKPWMFSRAREILLDLKEQYGEENCRAISLGDLPDDFGKQHMLPLYEETFNAAISFNIRFPDTLWCYGNHDVSYLWGYLESGYSYLAEPVVREKVKDLQKMTQQNLKFVHMIDQVIFSHAGLSRGFVDNLMPTANSTRDHQYVVDTVNNSRPEILWRDDSPLWFRPQLQSRVRTYYPRKLLQVVGHTPMKHVTFERGILSCDVFSTHSDGTKYGEEKFTVVDTVGQSWYTLE